MRADRSPDKANLHDFIRQLRGEDRYKGSLEVYSNSEAVQCILFRL